MKEKRKIFKASLMALFVIASVILCSSSVVSPQALKKEEKCQLTIYLSNGRTPFKNSRVQTILGGKCNGEIGKTFYTDKNGKVVLTWETGCEIAKINCGDGRYYPGLGYNNDYYNVNYKNGKKYELTLRKQTESSSVTLDPSGK